jgi:hypothetical protein
MTVRRSAPPQAYPRLSFVDQAALLGRGIVGNVRTALATPNDPSPGRAARKTRAATT